MFKFLKPVFVKLGNIAVKVRFKRNYSRLRQLDLPAQQFIYKTIGPQLKNELAAYYNVMSASLREKFSDSPDAKKLADSLDAQSIVFREGLLNGPNREEIAADIAALDKQYRADHMYDTPFEFFLDLAVALRDDFSIALLSGSEEVEELVVVKMGEWLESMEEHQENPSDAFAQIRDLMDSRTKVLTKEQGLLPPPNLRVVYSCECGRELQVSLSDFNVI